MPTTSITCPECDATLKLATSLPAGKKIKCPKCSTVFPVPGEEEDDDGAAIQSAPRLRKPLGQPAPAEDDEPEDEDDAPPARRASRKSAPVAEDDEEPEDDRDEEADDRPRRKSSRKRKKAKKLSGLMLGLIIGGVSLLVVGGAIGGVLWFFLGGGRNKGTGNEDPLAYVPADSTMIVGVDFGSLMNQPGIASQIEQSMMRQNGMDFFTKVKKETGLEFKDLMDHFVVAGKANANQNFNSGQAGTMILKSRVPFDQKKIANSAKDAEKKTANGKIYYKINEGQFKILFMPSDRIIVFSSLSENELTPIFKSDGVQLQIAPDTAAMARKASSSLGWVVVAIDPAMKQQMNNAMAMAAGAGPEVKNAVQQAKAIGVWGDLTGNKVKINAAVTLGDAASAQTVATTSQKEWANATKGLGAVQLKMGLALLPAGLKDVANEIVETLSFSSEGAMFQMTAQASLQSVEKFVKEVQNQPRPGVGGPPVGPGQGVFGPNGPVPQRGARPPGG